MGKINFASCYLLLNNFYKNRTSIIMNKLIAIILLSVSLFACKQNSKTESLKDKNSTSCDLKEIVEKLSIDAYNNITPSNSNKALLQDDFTTENLKKTVIDVEGTSWTKETLDNFRFIFKEGAYCDGCINNVPSELIVYKNSSIYRKYKNVTVEDIQTTKVDKIQCIFVEPFEQILNYSAEGGLVLSLKLYSGVKENSGDIKYFDGKISYSGQFKF